MYFHCSSNYIITYLTISEPKGREKRATKNVQLALQQLNDDDDDDDTFIKVSRL